MKNIKKEAERLMSINPNYTLEQAMDIAKYDLEYCNNDEDSKNYLVNETMFAFVTEEEAEDLYAKKAKAKTHKDLLTTAQKKHNATVAATVKADRVEYLVAELNKRPELFGEIGEYSETVITGIVPETGLPYSIKIAKHKAQKVFSKEVFRKPDAISVNDQRCMALAFIVATAPEGLFEAPAYEASSIGFANRDDKFGFGSIKLTHHKK